MSRISTILQLDPAQVATVDQCIRAHRYSGLASIASALSAQGIAVTLSTLHRYLRKLRERDALCAQPEEGTIIMIIERGTGEVRTLKTAAAASTVAHAFVTHCLASGLS